MATKKHYLFVGILLTVTIQLVGQNAILVKPKIEIYLINKFTKADSSQPKNNYFFPQKDELTDTAFIRDDELIAYNIYEKDLGRNHDTMYSFILSSSAQKKINSLTKIPLCCGRKFAITVNNEIIFGAYFWNIFSSFGCTWIVAPDRCDGELLLMKGMPIYYFDKSMQDPRGNQQLIEAFKATGRFVVK